LGPSDVTRCPSHLAKFSATFNTMYSELRPCTEKRVSLYNLVFNAESYSIWITHTSEEVHSPDRNQLSKTVVTFKWICPLINNDELSGAGETDVKPNIGKQSFCGTYGNVARCKNSDRVTEMQPSFLWNPPPSLAFREIVQGFLTKYTIVLLTNVDSSQFPMSG